MLPLEHKLWASLQKLLPDTSGLRIGVACSGGPDSVVLLSALLAITPLRSYRLRVLHVNHGLRPESDREQDMLQTMCQQWRVPLSVKKLQPPSGLKGIEAWAREARYAFFQESVAADPLDYVATAHTQDDQAETVLFHTMRGSARRGLAGIPPVRDNWLIRPFLHCSRREIDAYTQEKKLPYVTDPSNADLRFTRNKIRHVLLPFLEQEFSPQVRRHLASLAETTREEEDWLEGLATNARARTIGRDNSVSLPALDKEPVALRLRILRQWIEEHVHDVKTVHLFRLRDLSEGKIRGRVELPGRQAVVRRGTRLILQTRRPPIMERDYAYVLQAGQSRRLASRWDLSVSSAIEWHGDLNAARCTDRWSALFDCDLSGTEETCIVRNARVGDRIRPFGMRGHRKVQDAFVDAKVPQVLRSGFPVVEMNGEIAWVPGYVRGQRALVTVATRQVYRIQVNPLPVDEELW
ncbi:MAG: tRNA lysidine(34) synthetase TilS [Desulfurellaceae bacterium]|nr:tRNA lysidine(34) synthetase TilS [Desulfurellaceae bacterium]